LDAIEHPLAKYAKVCVQACAYIGSGNVLKIQEFLKLATPHKEEEKECLPQAMAVIGIALVAMTEKVGSEMATRSM
jgi:26S proteasome regulatory subunit N1